MVKQVLISPKPQVSQNSSAEEWLSGRQSTKNSIQMKRLTIDIPEGLHKAIKTACATRGTKIADEVRELLIQKYTGPR
jgi:hypothetical protein